MIGKTCVSLKSSNGRSDPWKRFCYNWPDICAMSSPPSPSVALFTTFFCTAPPWSYESLIALARTAQKNLTYTRNLKNSFELSRGTPWWTTKSWSWIYWSSWMTKADSSQSARMRQRKRTGCNWMKRHLSSNVRLCAEAQPAFALAIKQMSWSFHEHLTSDHRKQIISDWHLKME